MYALILLLAGCPKRAAPEWPRQLAGTGQAVLADAPQAWTFTPVDRGMLDVRVCGDVPVAVELDGAAWSEADGCQTTRLALSAARTVQMQVSGPSGAGYSVSAGFDARAPDHPGLAGWVRALYTAEADLDGGRLAMDPRACTLDLPGRGMNEERRTVRLRDVAEIVPRDTDLLFRCVADCVTEVRVTWTTGTPHAFFREPVPAASAAVPVRDVEAAARHFGALVERCD